MAIMMALPHYSDTYPGHHVLQRFARSVEVSSGPSEYHNRLLTITGVTMDTSSSTLVPPQAATQTRSRSIRVGVLSGISVLDPREATDNISGLILGQIYEAPYTISAGSTTVTPLLFSEALRPEPARGNLPVYSAAVRGGV